MAKYVKSLTGLNYLCLAGGVALNCVANGKLIKSSLFKDIWIQPASGDAGGALGAALGAYHIMLNKKRKPLDKIDNMKGSLLGPEYNESEIKDSLEGCGAVFSIHSQDQIIRLTAKDLADGKAVGLSLIHI